MPFPSFAVRTALALAACVGTLMSSPAFAAPKTICTITVNSADEKETFRRHLPPGDYRFVELVERGRPDWLASACRQHVSCDALIISGHFDGGDEFYTDRFDRSESLSVEEMERASCSESCPGVFAHLKEVYLFGCNTLKPEAHQDAAAEITRALVRAGQSPADAARLAAMLGEQHSRSNRERMQQIFRNVPVIYGFSSKAPLGRYAGPLLDRYFETAPAGEVGSGKTSAKLLGLFGPSSMTVTGGFTDGEPQANVRRDDCHFVDDRLAPAQKVEFMHQLLQRDMTQVRLYLDELEHFVGSIGPAQRFEKKTAAQFDAIDSDRAARERWLAFARDTDEPSVRTRMMALARKIGWLTPAEEQGEFLRMIAERMGRGLVGREDVDLACERGADDAGAAALQPIATNALRFAKLAPAAAVACLGSAQARARVVRAVASADPDDAVIAQAYLRRRPLTDAADVRMIAAAIARMPTAGAQVRALDTLAQQHVSDPESLREIAGLFPKVRSVEVQRAIAGILIRADHRVLGQAQLARTLRASRLKSPDGADVIDALIRVLQAG